MLQGSGAALPPAKHWRYCIQDRPGLRPECDELRFAATGGLQAGLDGARSALLVTETLRPGARIGRQDT